MATATETIDSAYRESNLIAVGASASTAQQAEALPLLNSIILSAVGNDAGQELADITIGGTYDQSEVVRTYIPENARLALNLSGGMTFNLHPRPYDGQRVALVDAAGNLATNNVTLDGNGRMIEGTATLTLNTDGESRQWLYRADLGDWVRLTSLVAADDLPFPTEFDDYFAILLALRLNPRHGRELTQSSGVWLETTAKRLEARYRRPRPLQDWGSLGLLGQRRYLYGRGDLLQ